MKGEGDNSKYREHLTHCQLCGDRTNGKKMRHMAKCHPEYKFTCVRSAKYGKLRTIYRCGFCQSELLSIMEMIPHQKRRHPLELKAGIVTGIPVKEINLPRTQGKSPMKETAMLDNFLGGLGSSLQELDVLRAEKAAWEKERAELETQIVEWEKRAKRWSEQVVELQQKISRPEL